MSWTCPKIVALVAIRFPMYDHFRRAVERPGSPGISYSEVSRGCKGQSKENARHYGAYCCWYHTGEPGLCRGRTACRRPSYRQRLHLVQLIPGTKWLPEPKVSELVGHLLNLLRVEMGVGQGAVDVPADGGGDDGVLGGIKAVHPLARRYAFHRPCTAKRQSDVSVRHAGHDRARRRRARLSRSYP